MHDKPCRILLIDDDAEDRFIFTRTVELLNLSFEITSFESAPDALQFLNGTEFSPADVPDIIVTDMNFPDTNGTEIIKAIRLIHHLDDVPIAAMSSYFQEYNYDKILSIGANMFFRKPITGEIILQLSSMVLQR